MIIVTAVSSSQDTTILFLQHIKPTPRQTAIGYKFTFKSLLSDAQNNTRSDGALKFLGQDHAKQPGITYKYTEY